MGWIGKNLESIRSIPMRQSLTQAISLGLVVTLALIFWNGLKGVTGTASPVVVVISGSMEPGFQRGDILFLRMNQEPIRAGEIVVFDVDNISYVMKILNPSRKLFFMLKLRTLGKDIPIVHRVIEVHEQQDTGEVDILTKGDNNPTNDRPLYPHGQLWLQRHHITGRAVGFLPYAGWATIIVTEHPVIKYLLIVALGLMILTSKD